MLRQLNITDFVIVEHVELEFSTGFTVLTGETGAGKSILIDALSLVLGERGSADHVRQGCMRAEISAVFAIDNRQELTVWLDENAMQGDADECLLRRVVDAKGRSRAFINGHAATLQQLRTVGEFLVAVHSQHVHQLLLQKEAQRDVLDAFGQCRELAQQVKATYQHWQILHRQRTESARRQSEYREKHEQLAWQVKELSELNCSVDEWNSLQTDHHRLSNLAGLLAATESAVDALSENETAIIAQINAVKTRLQHVVEYDQQLQTTIDLLDSAQIQVQESIYELRHYREQLDLNPNDLQTVEQRISDIHQMARRHRVLPEELPDLLEQLEAQLTSLEHGEDLDALIKREQDAKREYLKNAKVLTGKRSKAAKAMSEAVTESMQSLAMAGGSFSVLLRPLEAESAYGLEQVEFQVTAHQSLPQKPLVKVASGGELSRISLAIQVMAGTAGTVPTLVFDEVDVGIGGASCRNCRPTAQTTGPIAPSIVRNPPAAGCRDRRSSLAGCQSRCYEKAGIQPD